MGKLNLMIKVVPSEAVAGRLLSMMEVAEDNGDLVILEVVT